VKVKPAVGIEVPPKLMVGLDLEQAAARLVRLVAEVSSELGATPGTGEVTLVVGVTTGSLGSMLGLDLGVRLECSMGIPGVLSLVKLVNGGSTIPPLRGSLGLTT